MDVTVIILAAGKGTRMQSTLPKVMHLVGGKPLLQHVIETAQSLSPAKIVGVYGHGLNRAPPELAHFPITWVPQAEPLGTGHAVRQTIDVLDPRHRALVLYGDVPLIPQPTLQRLIELTPAPAIGWLTVEIDDPTGYGRILRDEHRRPLAIVEEKDASPEERQVREINTGICLIPVPLLRQWLPLLKNDNRQKEYYLTDLFAMAIKAGVPIHTVQTDSFQEVRGVNDPAQLAAAEKTFQERRKG